MPKVKSGKGFIRKFKTIEEQDEWELKHRLEGKQKLEEIDRYEYSRSGFKLYPPGIYRFKTIDEQQQDEFKRVMKVREKRARYGHK